MKLFIFYEQADSTVFVISWIEIFPIVRDCHPASQLYFLLVEVIYRIDNIF